MPIGLGSGGEAACAHPREMDSEGGLPHEAILPKWTFSKAAQTMQEVSGGSSVKYGTLAVGSTGAERRQSKAKRALVKRCLPPPEASAHSATTPGLYAWAPASFRELLTEVHGTG